MSDLHDIGNVLRTEYLVDEFRTKRSALKLLKASSIQNKDAIIASYKKEMYLQAYPCYVLMLLMVVGLFLLLWGEDKGNVGPYVGTGLILFTVCFLAFLLVVGVTVFLFRKDLYPQYINWFKTADEKQLEQVLSESVVFQDGCMKQVE